MKYKTKYSTLFIFIGSIAFLAALYIQYYINVEAFPQRYSSKPAFFLLFQVPVAFETSVLITCLSLIGYFVIRWSIKKK